METLLSRIPKCHALLRNLYLSSYHNTAIISSVTPRILQNPALCSCPTYFTSSSSSTTTTTTSPPVTLKRSLTRPRPKSGSIMTKIRQWLNWEKKPPKTALQSTGYLWYCKIADEINFDAFYKAFKLPDTFTSWFAVVELHVWLLSTRLMEEPETGKIVRNAMIQAMWQDVEVRSKKLEGALSAARREQIQELNEQFQAALLGYDEGLLSENDTILAGALWRKFLNLGTNESSEPPETRQDATRMLLDDVIALELLVSYVHAEHYRLQQLSRENVLLYREYQWHPFDQQLGEIRKFHKR